MSTRTGIFLTILVSLSLTMTPSTAWATPERTLARGMNAFALSLYGNLATRPGNLFFSPYSISTALAMTGLGARKGTRTQMSTVLHLPLDKRELHQACAALIGRLDEPAAPGSYQLAIANRLWGQKDATFLPGFLASSKRYYGAGLEPLDFRKNTEGARTTINDWVALKTQRRILDLIGPGALLPTTKLVLTNAIYFKGSWVEAFDKGRTSNQPFTLASGRKTRVELMGQTARFGYGERPGVQMLELPYKGDDLSLVVLLPKSHRGLPALEKDLARRGADAYLQGMNKTEVKVYLPRFKMSWGAELKDSLVALGMPDAFSDVEADFSGMTGTPYLRIDKVIHKAFVDVNEEGTEAAAATAVMMVPKCAAFGGPPVPVFSADRPFVFLIRCRRSGAILFLGRLSTPTP